jgi:Ca2+:H+ antiporter
MATERQSLISNNSDYGSTSEGGTHRIYKSPTSSTPLYTSPPPTFSESIKIILYSSRINYLLVFIPLGFLAYILGWSDTWVFTLNFLAILPLAKLLDFATEEVSLRVGQV